MLELRLHKRMDGSHRHEVRMAMLLLHALTQTAGQGDYDPHSRDRKCMTIFWPEEPGNASLQATNLAIGISPPPRSVMTPSESPLG
jgi:hypothetical protein